MNVENPQAEPIDFLQTKAYVYAKWVVLIISYAFLIYKIVVFEHYQSFIAQWIKMPITQFVWLLLAVFLLPLNWFVESLKWKHLVSKFQLITLSIAFKAVLAGIVTGFFTPNRIGEMLGRIMYLDKGNRKAGITVSVVNSLTQNLIMAICGLPAAILFFSEDKVKNANYLSVYLLLVLLFVLMFGLLYFLLPTIFNYIKTSLKNNKFDNFYNYLTYYSTKDLMHIMLITLIRYVVFCTQFYLLLQFFEVDLTAYQALVAIPTSYLLVTFTPSVAFSEAAVRSSYAVLIIGAFSSNELSIIFAGTSVWLLNFALPMIVGTFVMNKQKKSI